MLSTETAGALVEGVPAAQVSTVVLLKRKSIKGQGVKSAGDVVRLAAHEARYLVGYRFARYATEEECSPRT